MSIKEGLKNSKIGQFWLVYSEKIILVAGIILITAISFEAGLLQGKKNPNESVIVNKTACNPCEKLANENESKTNTVKTTTVKSTETPITEKQNCSFVASKNSNKFHLATCQWATKIKSENKICFSTAEEAISRGYQGAKCCVK